MVRKLVPWLAASVLFAAAAMVLQVRVPGTRAAVEQAQFAGGDRTPPPVRSVPWDRSWPTLVRSGPRWRNGAEFVLLTREGRLEGVRTSRERWLLLRRDTLGGDFEVQRSGRPARVSWLPFHPDVPDLPMRSRRLHGVHPCAGGLVAVTVPAGRFRCGRTWRNAEARDGAPERVDEWWAPGIPVPVQRWTRRVGVVDTLVPPPRRVADMLVGTEWAVLERIRQR